jgi:hypothetical protein
MTFSLVRATGWLLTLAGMLLFVQAVQLLLGSAGFFGFGLFGLVFGGQGAALVESAVGALVCLLAGGWLLRSR